MHLSTWEDKSISLIRWVFYLEERDWVKYIRHNDLLSNKREVLEQKKRFRRTKAYLPYKTIFYNKVAHDV